MKRGNFIRSIVFTGAACGLTGKVFVQSITQRYRYTNLIDSITRWKDQVPKLFLIGDSISIHYGPYLKQYLEGIANYERKQDDGQAEQNMKVPEGANGGDSRMVLAYLNTKIKDSSFSPDYLLLNCGLHDIKRDTLVDKVQVSEDEYRENLQTIMDLTQDNDIKLIWIKTTPVVDSIHNSQTKSFKRYSADVNRYNRIADKICAVNQIPVIDLFSFTERLGVKQFIDHVHFKPSARMLQAAYIAGSFQHYLSHCENT